MCVLKLVYTKYLFLYFSIFLYFYIFSKKIPMLLGRDVSLSPERVVVQINSFLSQIDAEFNADLKNVEFARYISKGLEDILNFVLATSP